MTALQPQQQAEWATQIARRKPARRWRSALTGGLELCHRSCYVDTGQPGEAAASLRAGLPSEAPPDDGAQSNATTFAPRAWSAWPAGVRAHTRGAKRHGQCQVLVVRVVQVI